VKPGADTPVQLRKTCILYVTNANRVTVQSVKVISDKFYVPGLLYVVRLTV